MLLHAYKNEQQQLLGCNDLSIQPLVSLPYPLPANMEVIALLNTIDEHTMQASSQLLAIVGNGCSAEVKAMFHPMDLRATFGGVTLVGFGPGNPDLLTIGGLRALEAADIIYYDDLIDHDFLTQFTCEKVYVGKRKGKHSKSQDGINQLLVDAAYEGKKVVRLKGGDPMIFAHGGEEVEFLQRHFIEVKVIPGISAGIALSAYTKIPLTHRGISKSVSFITGHSAKIELPKTETVVIYMGGSNIRQIAQNAIAAKWRKDTPVALIYNVSMPDQKEYYSNLEELAQRDEKYPTPVIILVGEVVRFKTRSRQRSGIIEG